MYFINFPSPGVDTFPSFLYSALRCLSCLSSLSVPDTCVSTAAEGRAFLSTPHSAPPSSTFADDAMQTRSRSTAGTFGISELVITTDDSAQSPPKRLRNRGRRGISGDADARPEAPLRGPSSSPSRRRSQFPVFNGTETPPVEYTEPEPEQEDPDDPDVVPAGTLRGFASIVFYTACAFAVLSFTFGETLGHPAGLFAVLFVLVFDRFSFKIKISRKWRQKWDESAPVIFCAVYEFLQIVIGLCFDVDRIYFNSESTDKSKILGAFIMNTILGNVCSLLLFAFYAPAHGTSVMFMDFLAMFGMTRMLSMVSFTTANLNPILDTQQSRSGITITCVLLALFARRVARKVRKNIKFTRWGTTVDGIYHELPSDGTASRLALMVSVGVNGCRWILPLFWAACPTQALLGKGMAPTTAAEHGRMTFLMGYMLLMILHQMLAICVDDPTFVKTYNAMRLCIELFSMGVLGFEANKFFKSPEVLRALARAYGGTESAVTWVMWRTNSVDFVCKFFIMVVQISALVWDKFFDKIPTPTQTGDSQSSR